MTIQKTDDKAAETQKAKNPVVLIETSMGTIKIELFEKNAPLTVKNFMSYVKEKFYDGTIFHRVVPDFVIQGGGFTQDMTQKPTKAAVKNEATNKISNTAGTVAMARTSVVDSATSQFFINLRDNLFLDHKDETDQGFGYCVFGKVIEGMDVVTKIGKVPTATKGFNRDVPVTPVVIKSVQSIP
ncbi:MAG: peptidylprolyl isomerase [bacterium]